MILLWGLPGDGPLAQVARHLRERRAEYVLLDQRRLAGMHVQLRAAMRLEASVEVEGRTIELDRVEAAYIRPHDVRRLPAVAAAGPLSSLWARALEIEDLLLSWAGLTPAFVINRPEAMTSNDSKPYQAQLAVRAGFSVPPTLVTTDPDAALEFWAEHGEVIYKSISGTRSIVRRVDATHRDRIDDVAWCPTQFQRYVPGTDYRVHVVGDDLFASRIDSDRDDYRYAAWQGGDTRVRAATVPVEVGQRCQDLARALQLAVAGIDLRRTPDGEWYCFEANPSPGFTFYERQTGQPIAAAVAGLLVRATGLMPGRARQTTVR